MKKYSLPAIKLTLISILFFCGIYSLVLWGIAQYSPYAGQGEIVDYHDRKQYSTIGQAFTKDNYFRSRPSAIQYNAAKSGGSNKGPSNKEYLAEVQARIDTFLRHNPEIDRSQIPVDLVTSSGSSLDPHISVQAAKVQVKRIAKIRNSTEEKLTELITQHTEEPLWGLFGPQKINVLKLNIALDDLK